MEKKWEEKKNRLVAEKRQDEEIIEHVQQWSLNKARLEKNINRKIDSSKFQSKYERF